MKQNARYNSLYYVFLIYVELRMPRPARFPITQLEGSRAPEYKGVTLNSRSTFGLHGISSIGNTEMTIISRQLWATAGESGTLLIIP